MVLKKWETRGGLFLDISAYFHSQTQTASPQNERRRVQQSARVVLVERNKTLLKEETVCEQASLYACVCCIDSTYSHTSAAMSGKSGSL